MGVKTVVQSLAVMAMTLFQTGQCLASTDTITWGGDNSRSGYFPNNNMDPAVVTSSDFGQIFRVKLPGNYLGQAERIFSQPLIYTPSNGDGTQYVYWATAQNNVYKMNAKTGDIVASRSLHIPFMSADLKGDDTQAGYCQDINPTVGIIGTGVIDPDSDTLYLTAKTYEDQTKIGVPQGRPAGRIYVHALNVNDLSERPGFPINLEGMAARNNPTRLFNGGIHNQRPGLLHPKGSDYIYAGFGSHCVNYNFTGWVVGWHKTTGQIVERYATQGEGVPNNKKGASLWMSGGGITSDDKGSMFFATGNGYSEQVKDIPINRGTIPTSLEEAIVHMTYNADGTVTPVDFFIPANIGYLNGGDLDLGTSPVAMLPSDTFSCGGVKRIGIVTGKDHTTWFLNLDDLGGYKTGEGKTDRVLGKYSNENSVYAGVGVYPLEGGYVYVNVINFQSRVFKFSCAGGVPSFTRVAESPNTGKNGFGVSHGTVTSLNGQAGTGLYWVTDVNDNNPEGYSVRIYDAVPVGGTLKLVKGFKVGAINKFTRPHFGDGIVYFGSSDGFVYGFGAPTNPALNCTSGPLQFGTVGIGAQSAAKTITCIAKIGTTVANISLASSDFSVADLPVFPRQMAAQTSFSFKATFNPTTYGNLSASVLLSTANSVGGYATTTSVRLTGVGESAGGLLVAKPDRVTFSQAVVGADTLVDSVILSNAGNSLVNIDSFQFSEVSLTGPFVPANVSGNVAQFGLFTLSNIPSTIAALSQQLVSVGFNPATSGNHSLFVNINSDGGSVAITISASAGGTPTALIQMEMPDGSGWQTWTPGSSSALSFGNVMQNTDRRLRFRITNNAPAGSVPLNIPISKPPFGVPGLISTVNQADIGEGTTIKAGEYAEAVIVCTAPKTQWNTDSYTNVTSWVFNTNDVNLGKFQVPFTCTATAQQGGPLMDDGSGQYRYVGCFRENYPSGRQLKSQLYGAADNTADKCLAACAAKGFAFCGMQYHRECWGGPTPPAVEVGELNCNFDCSGDISQWCGGDGVNALAGNPHISLFATNTTLPPPVANPGGPYVNPGTNGYVSIGCYTEATNARALGNGVSTNGVKTVAACISACAARNYKYIGLEYGGECWCDNQFAAGSVPTALSECSMTCDGNATEFCGAGSRLNVYQLQAAASSSTSSVSSTVSTSSVSSISTSVSSTVSSVSVSITTTTSSSATPTSTGIRDIIGLYRYQGCYGETTQGGRSLAGKTYADDLMTLEKCAAACEGFTYWGTEYTRECYCGNELRGNTALDPDQKTCDMMCGADRTQYCGGRSRLSVYKFDASLNVTVSSTSSSSLTSTSSSSLSSSSASVSASSTTSSSLSTSLSTSSSTVPVSSTSSSTSSSLTSSSASSSVTPTSSSSSSISTSSSSTSSSSISSTSSSTITSPSSTSSSTTSSSSSTSSSFSTTSTSTSSLSSSTSTSSSTTSSSTSSTSSTSSSPSPTPLWPGNANFTYYHCVSEPSNGRLLKKQVINLADMTQTKCLEACWMFQYAGIEYGKECWCGDGPINWAGNVGATPGGNATEPECSKDCPGDSALPALKRGKCGASKRLNLFVRRDNVTLVN